MTMNIKMPSRPPSLPKLAAFLIATSALFVAGCGGARAPEASQPPAPSVAPQESAEVLRRADESYAARENLDNVREGLKTLRRIRAVEHDNYEASWRVARLDYTLGDKSADAAEREQAFLDGTEAGETATKAEPQRPEGHFWLGANYGGYAEFKGALYGVSGAVKMRREMETVLKLDEGFQGGSAQMVLGRLDLELPEMLGGDPERAVATLEKGIGYGGQNALLHYWLAEAYLRLKRRDDARRQIDFVLHMKPHPDFQPEHKEAVEKAHALLQKHLS